MSSVSVSSRRGGGVAKWWRWSVGAGVSLVVLLAIVGPVLAPYPAERAVGMPFAGPGGGAVLGTDRLGRDVLSHLLTGGFELLVVSAVIAVVVTVLSALLGAVAAVRPRAATVIALGGDLLILLPAVLGILLVLTAWPQGGVFALIAVSLLFGVPYCARIFASAAAGIAATGYVEAAIASGESLTHLVFREILPNLRSVFTTQLGLRFVVAVYLVSTVAFLGVSALDDDNWANMVRDNASGLLLNPWATLAPSAAIAIVAVGINLVVTAGPTRMSPGSATIPGSTGDTASGREAASSTVDAVASREAGASVSDLPVTGGRAGTLPDGASVPVSSGDAVSGREAEPSSGDAVSGRGTELSAGDAVSGRETRASAADLLATGDSARTSPGSAGIPGSAGDATSGREAASSGGDTVSGRVAELSAADLLVTGDPVRASAGGASTPGSAGDAVPSREAEPSVPVMAAESPVGGSVADGGDHGSRGGAGSAAGPKQSGGAPSLDDGAAVVVEDLTVVAHSGAVLLAPLSFRLKPGTVTALTGASGAGKSTAMRALLGHVPPGVTRTGAVRVAGQDVFALDSVALRTFRRTRIAYVGQDPGSELNPLLRVRTLLAEAAPTASDADRLAALETVGLDATHLRRRCGRLSGGQQRRVALARALLRRPDVVVLDEPLAGLHGALRTEIAHLIAGLATDGSTAVLLSGHDTKTIHAIADTVLEVHPPGGSTTVDSGPTAPHRTDLPEHDAGSAELDREGLADRPTALRAKTIRASANGEDLLHDIAFAVGAGEALAVVGPSGAGKTTLARVIAGLHRTATGTLEVRGTAIRVGRRRRIRAGANGIQLVTQNPLGALNPRRTVEQTLARPLRRIAGVPKAELGARIQSLLTAVELPADIATRHPAELSGGQRQRVALARALAADPAVLICDEITTALDPATAAAIMTLLDDLRATRATAVVLISHDMALVTAHCTELLVLDHGRVVESGATATVLAAPTHQATAALLG
ncbi:ATP-binding cassette domain-containing protein [Nocardia sp. NPDC050717]|uniref:ATP-binding cassette domain-containing protein n=1 Tax=Nocardia sp. NPDC050717 TaxID=3157221 RepID=UPI0033D5D1DD